MKNTFDDIDAVPQEEWSPERIVRISWFIGAVIAGGIALGVFAATVKLYYIGACIGAALLVVLVAWQFEAALLIYVLIAFIPWGETPGLAVGGSGVSKGLFVSELMLSFLLMIWCGKYLLKQLPKPRIRSGFYKPILFYISYSIINVIHSYIFWDIHVRRSHQYLAANVVDLGFRFLSIGALVMIATSISDAKWLRRITLFALIPGIYNAIGNLLGDLPLSAPWWPLLTFLPASYFLAVSLDQDKLVPVRMAAIIAAGGLLFTVLIKNTAWVSGWAGLLAALAVVILARSRKLFFASIFAMVIIVMISWPFISKDIIKKSRDEGDFDRFTLLAGSLRYAITFPLGIGLGNYRTYNSFYYGEKWHTTSYTSAHGTYSQHLAEMGIPGTILFLAVLIGGFSWLLRHYRKMTRGSSKTFLLAAMAQLTGIAFASIIGDYIIPSYHNGGIVTFSATVYSWITWGLAIAHVRISENTIVNEGKQY